MKQHNNVYKWIRNITLVTAILSATWIIGKAACLWMLFVSNRQFFSDVEWTKLSQMTIIDIVFLSVFIISFIVFMKCKQNAKENE